MTNGPLANSKRIVIKVGSALLVDSAAGSVKRDWLATLAADIAATIQAVCKVRGRVAIAGPGELPNDGKVIADLRSYR